MPISLETVAAEDYSREYLWDILFPDFSNTWFPAVDVEEGLGSINSHEMPFYLGAFKVPQNSSPLDIKVTFAELADHRVLKFLQDWYASVFPNDGQHVGVLSSIAKQVHIMKLRPDRTVLSQRIYFVYPEGELYYHGSSEGNVELMTQQFVIVGK